MNVLTSATNVWHQGDTGRVTATEGRCSMRLVARSMAFALLLSLCALLFFGGAARADDWKQVNLPGFGNPGIAGCGDMIQYKSSLYCIAGGDSNTGSFLWRYDGSGPGGWSNVTPAGARGLGSLVADGDCMYALNYEMGVGPYVLRYDGSGWTRIESPGFIPSMLTFFKGTLYLGTGNEVMGPSQVWRYDGGNKWTRVNTDGFGDPRNEDVYAMAQYGDSLYAGTLNAATGAEVWKYDGRAWTQVNEDGFGEAANEEVMSFVVYNGCLYAGSGNSDTGGKVMRYDGGTGWTQVNEDGFGASWTISCFAQFNGNLFVGTSGNCEVWKYDCAGWTQVNEDGFGDHLNLGVDTMCIYNDRIFAGTYNIGDIDTSTGAGCQVWEMADETVPTSRNWGTGSIGDSRPATTWYLAEGSTGGGMETWILVQNPNNRPADIHLTYMTSNGSKAGPSTRIGPNSRATFDVARDVPDNWGVSTVVSSDMPVVAERSMYGAGRAWGTDSVGASELSRTWYLAEGSTGGGFETWVEVQNPGDEPTSVRLTYLTENGSVAGPVATLKPMSRATFEVSSTVPNDWEVSTVVSAEKPVVAERAVYWNRKKGATESIGVTKPAKKWYLAEGSTGGDFETWVLVENPGAEPASVDLTYMTGTGQKPGPHLQLAPMSRRTVKVSEMVPGDWSVSTVVSSDKPVVAERAVYWGHGIEGTDSIGTQAPSTTWYLAEGSTGRSFETWVLVQNPGDSPVNIEMTFMTRGGPIYGPTDTLPAHSRKSYNAALWCQANQQVATWVRSSGGSVVVERSVYGDPL